MYKTYFKIPAIRSQKYTDWVKTLPSVISGRPADDPHHIKRKGYGGTVKVDDFLVIPLTRDEHTEFHSMPWNEWEEKHGDQRDHAIKTIAQAFREGVLKVDL